MGWGTQFNVDMYLSRVDIKTVDEANEAIKDCEGILNLYEQELLILASLNNAPNKDRTLEDIVFDIRTKVSEAVEGIKEEMTNLVNLEILRNYLEEGGKVEVV